MDLQKKIDYRFFGDFDKDESEEVLEELEDKGLILFLHTTSHFTKFTELFKEYLRKNNLEDVNYIQGFGWAGNGDYYYFYRNSKLFSDEEAQQVLKKI